MRKSQQYRYFRDKVAIVTGGAAGIGKGLAVELGRYGAKVVIADIDGAKTERTAEELRGQGYAVMARVIDVAKAESVQSVLDDAIGAWGRVDYMFNNAGISLGGNLEDLRTEHWQTIIGVNLWGVIHGSSSAYRIMLRHGRGHIINVASLAGIVPSLGAPYSTTKHAVVGFSQSLRMEAMPKGVNVSVVCPGFVRTGIYEKTVNVSDQDHLEKARQWLSTAKMASIEESAKEILEGVIRNKGIITVTPFARNTWRLYRLFPELFMKFFALKSQNRYAKVFTFIRKTISW